MRKSLVVLSLTGILVLMFTGAAFAYDQLGDRTKTPIDPKTCIECHENTDKHTAGPHGGYTTGTDKCSTCHDVHADAENAQLLMGTTVTGACNFCHDLTATWAGPYNMTEDYPGEFVPAAAHRVVGIDIDPYTDTEGDDNSSLDEGIISIPGGNQSDGSVLDLVYTSQGKLSGEVFTCNSCHTPHGVNTVKPYLGESNVKVLTEGLPEGEFSIAVTNRLLKSKPNDLTTAVTNYGSAWCAACHKGRDNNIIVKHNHPVDETAPAYLFMELAQKNGLIKGGKTIAEVVYDGWVTVGAVYGELTADPRSNQQYAMNDVCELTNTIRNTKDGYDPIANYAGKGPSCQQCHGSAREVEDSYAANGKPRRASFPHISVNAGLLVESKDDFCTNCHKPSILP